MRVKTIAISEEVLDVLKKSKITENSVTLPCLLLRPLYEATNKVLVNAGGKWNKKAKAHVFPGDPREKLGLAIETGKSINEQQTFQSFYTPPDICRQMVELAEVNKDHTVLEPSAGTGNILKALQEKINSNIKATVKVEILGESVRIKVPRSVMAIEINPEIAKKLADNFPGVIVETANFLDYKAEPYADRILMNPPFSRGADILHIKHAIKFLKPGGRLVAICLNGPKQQKALKPLTAYWEELPEETFKAEGTKVKTAMLLIERC